MPPIAAPAYWPPGSQEWYDRGYADGRAGRTAEAVPADRLQVYQLGRADQQAGRERQVLKTTDKDLPIAQKERPPVPAPPAPPGQVSPQQGQALWEQGYRDGYASAPPRGDVGPQESPVAGTAGDYYWRGYTTGSADRQRGAPAARAGRGLPLLDPAMGYEVYGSVPLFGGVPYNVARVTDNFLPVRFQLLGGQPSDWRRGFRLSGPQGRAIQLARELYGARTPQEVGLPGWVAVVEWDPGEGRIVRLLEADELDEIADYLKPSRAY